MFELHRSAEDAMLERLVGQIRQHPAEIMRLPQPERRMAELALSGQDVHGIAQHVAISEGAVWDFLENLARSVSGDVPERPRETAGLGSDLDPGVTGGYGDTGFGAIGVEEEEEGKEQ